MGRYISMEAKKTIKIILILALSAIFIFLAVLWINDHIEKKESLALVKELDFSNPLALNSHDLMIGDGPLDIIVYEDYSDVFSADFAQTIERLQVDFSGQIRVIYRFTKASNSDLASKAALAVNCAQDQGQGLTMRQVLLSNTASNILNEEGIKLAVEQVGLNEDKFNQCFSSLDKKRDIEQLYDLSQLVPVYGAPTTFVDKEIVLGARPYDPFTDSNGDEIEGLKQVVERHLN
jgi:protein-disulfide isomerase